MSAAAAGASEFGDVKHTGPRKAKNSGFYTAFNTISLSSRRGTTIAAETTRPNKAHVFKFPRSYQEIQKRSEMKSDVPGCVLALRRYNIWGGL